MRCSMARLPLSRLSLLLLLLQVPAAGLSSAGSELRDGDVIFHTSRTQQSQAVQRATGSRYSHMGVVFLRHGQPHVFEAASTVRFTPLHQWVARGEGRHFVVTRLRDAEHTLTVEALDALRRVAGEFAGRPYDPAFGWSDERLYCSELVWKLYERAVAIQLGRLRRLRDFNLTDPAVRQELQKRYGNGFPLDEPVISPADILASERLVVVLER